MAEKRYTLEDVNEEILNHTDRYLKRTMINAKNSYYRKISIKDKKITIINIENIQDILADNDDLFDDLLCEVFLVKNIKIRIFDNALSKALSNITDRQRNVLLLNVALDIPLSKVAHSFGISLRAVEKHKQKALEKIRKEMKILWKTKKKVQKYLLKLFLMC